MMECHQVNPYILYSLMAVGWLPISYTSATLMAKEIRSQSQLISWEQMGLAYKELGSEF
jgi:hypothetical protein